LIENARKQINDEPNLSQGIKSLVEVLIAVIQMLAGKRLPKNSKNSNVPPSMDPNRVKSQNQNWKESPAGSLGMRAFRCNRPKIPTR
jgi:hypothetical protein